MMTRERINEIIALVLFSIGIFLLISFISYEPTDVPFFNAAVPETLHTWTGMFGAYSAFAFFFTFGYCAYGVPAIFIFWSICLFMQKMPTKLFPKILGFLVMLVALSCVSALMFVENAKISGGGIVGYVTSTVLSNYLGVGGTLIYSLFFLCLSFLLATDFLLYELFKFVVAKCRFMLRLLLAALLLPLKLVPKSSKVKAKKPQPAPKKRPFFMRKSAAPADKDADQGETKDPRAELPDVPLKIKKYEDQIKRVNKQSKVELPADDETDIDISEELDKTLQNGEDVLHPTRAEDRVRLKGADDDEAEETLDVDDDEDEDDADDGVAAKDAADEKAAAAANAAAPAAKSADATEADADAEYRFVAVGSEDDTEAYKLPSLNLIEDPKMHAEFKDDLHGNSAIIEQCLANFDIHVKVTEVEQGPVITRYEILAAPGTKLSRIIGLQDDIGLAMKTPSVRIAPMPGKNTIGIEIPNSVTNMVYLKELLNNISQKAQKFSLPMLLGKNTSGAPLIADLADMPHLLIAGTTGSGKTVCMNAIIVGMLYRMKPSELKFVMIDPKMVELAIYNGIPHLLAPVVTDPQKAATVLNWVVQEMENRYKLLALVGVRNIRSYNARVRSEKEDDDKKLPAALPYIVVVIDELADLMLTAAEKVETAIARLAQLSRAVGIHLILATQRPSVNVITGVIKANFPARLSFKVASKVDSRTVLDMIGADKLLGKGDMLFLEPGQAKPARAQSAFITDKEIRDVVQFIKTQREATYVDQVQNIVSGKVTAQINMDKDDMYDEAVRVVLDTGQASVSVLQRRLRLGYARAARIIDMMEANGVVGPYQGSKPREILVDRDTYKV